MLLVHFFERNPLCLWKDEDPDVRPPSVEMTWVDTGASAATALISGGMAGWG